MHNPSNTRSKRSCLNLTFCAVSNLCISDLSAWLSCFAMASTIHSLTPLPGSVAAAADDIIGWDEAKRVSHGLGVGRNSSTNFWSKQISACVTV